MGLGFGKEVDDVEHDERSEGELGHLHGDPPALTLGGPGTGAVRTESNPVSYRAGVESASANSDRQRQLNASPPTGLLLVQSQLVPVSLHAVSQLHPQLGLLLGGHGFPALLDAGEGGIRDGMVGRRTGLLGSDELGLSLGTGVQASNWGRGGAVGADGSRGEGRTASSSSRDGAEEHCVGERVPE